MSLIIKNQQAKTVEEVNANVLDLSIQALSKQQLVNGLPDLVSGTIDTGSPTTDEIIVSLINRVEKLITNVKG